MDIYSLYFPMCIFENPIEATLTNVGKYSSYMHKN